MAVSLSVLILCGTFSLLRGQSALPAAETNSNPGKFDLKSPPDPLDSRGEEVISSDDILDVYVVDVPEISRQYRVSWNGSITLPLLPEPISAAGLTPAQLSKDIGEKLHASGMVSKPQVTVAIRESRLHSIAVAGAVKKPQLYSFFGRTTLLDALSQAGGLADDAGNIATISRGEIGLRMREREGAPGTAVPSEVVTVDLKRLLETGNATLNVDLYPGDRVMIQRAGLIYVVGAVNKPGGFTLKNDREEMTVLKALALAEDLKPTAIRSKATIIRKDSGSLGGRKEIAINLEKVLSGGAPDQPLLANDILFVPDSTSKRALRRGAEAAIQMVTGVIIWRR